MSIVKEISERIQILEKTFDGLWLQKMFPNVVQKANSSKKWNVYSYGNRFDLKLR